MQPTTSRMLHRFFSRASTSACLLKIQDAPKLKMTKKKDANFHLAVFNFPLSKVHEALAKNSMTQLAPFCRWAHESTSFSIQLKSTQSTLWNLWPRILNKQMYFFPFSKQKKRPRIKNLKSESVLEFLSWKSDSANGQPSNFWGLQGKIKFKLLFHGPLAE